MVWLFYRPNQNSTNLTGLKISANIGTKTMHTPTWGIKNLSTCVLLNYLIWCISWWKDYAEMQESRGAPAKKPAPDYFLWKLNQWIITFYPPIWLWAEWSKMIGMVTMPLSDAKRSCTHTSQCLAHMVASQIGNIGNLLSVDCWAALSFLFLSFPIFWIFFSFNL